MISKSSQNNSIPRIRSFLSPLGRFGNRSYSTSQLCTSKTSELHKTYIEFKRITRVNGSTLNKQANNQLRLTQFFRSPDSKGTKLTKANINRNTFKQERATYKHENYEKDQQNVSELIKVLSEQIHTLEIQKRILLEKHEEDMIRNAHQIQIIRNLEQAICLCRKQSDCFPQAQMSFVKDKKNSGIQEDLKIKICELQLENNKIMQRYQLVVEELEKMKYQSLDITKEETKKNFNEKAICRSEDQLERILMDIQRKKLKQFQQIDSLLFGSCL